MGGEPYNIGTGCPAQIPFRRVKLTDDNGHFDLYDTSGPQVIEKCKPMTALSACPGRGRGCMPTEHGHAKQGISAREGLPKIRADWVAAREARGDKVCTQQHYAKKGIITEEMAFCAARERIDPEFVSSEVCTYPPTLKLASPHTLKDAAVMLACLGPLATFALF